MLANPPKGGCHGALPGVLGPVVAWQPGVQGSRLWDLVLTNRATIPEEAHGTPAGGGEYTRERLAG